MIVAKIDNKVAQSISITNHYLHRKCPCSVAYGLYKDDDIVGVCIYGVPSSSTLKRGVCGEDEADHVIELKRLWVSDDIGNFPRIDTHIQIIEIT